MKSSQKGTKLNDVRYFRQSRPYARKRITTMRVIPDIPGLHGSPISSRKDEVSPSTYPKGSERSRDRCITLDRDQRSREIAWINYTSDSEDSQDSCPAKFNSRSRGRDAFAETDPDREIHVFTPEPAYFAPEVGENVNNETKLETEKEVQVKLELQTEEKNIGVEDMPMERSEPKVLAKLELRMEEKNIGAEDLPMEQLEPKVHAKPEVREESQAVIAREVPREVPQVRPDKNSTDSERSFWLRYGGIRKILDFFGNFFGRSATEDHDKEVTRTVEHRQLVERSVDNPFTAKPNKADYIIKSQVKRSSKRNDSPARKYAATKQPEDHEFSGLTRQIMNTGDKRLRATLVEHEMRARKLEEENRRYRRILEQKLKTRQMSSPLH